MWTFFFCVLSPESLQFNFFANRTLFENFIEICVAFCQFISKDISQGGHKEKKHKKHKHKHKDHHDKEKHKSHYHDKEKHKSHHHEKKVSILGKLESSIFADDRLMSEPMDREIDGKAFHIKDHSKVPDGELVGPKKKRARIGAEVGEFTVHLFGEKCGFRLSGCSKLILRVLEHRAYSDSWDESGGGREVFEAFQIR